MLPDKSELLRMCVRQWLEQDRIEQRKYDGVRRYRERDCTHDDYRKQGHFGIHGNGIVEITQNVFGAHRDRSGQYVPRRTQNVAPAGRLRLEMLPHRRCVRRAKVTRISKEQQREQPAQPRIHANASAGISRLLEAIRTAWARRSASACAM